MTRSLPCLCLALTGALAAALAQGHVAAAREAADHQDAHLLQPGVGPVVLDTVAAAVREAVATLESGFRRMMATCRSATRVRPRHA